MPTADKKPDKKKKRAPRAKKAKKEPVRVVKFKTVPHATGSSISTKSITTKESDTYTSKPSQQKPVVIHNYLYLPGQSSASTFDYLGKTASQIPIAKAEVIPGGYNVSSTQAMVYPNEYVGERIPGKSTTTAPYDEIPEKIKYTPPEFDNPFWEWNPSPREKDYSTLTTPREKEPISESSTTLGIGELFPEPPPPPFPSPPEPAEGKEKQPPRAPLKKDVDEYKIFLAERGAPYTLAEARLLFDLKGDLRQSTNKDRVRYEQLKADGMIKL